MTGDYNDLPQK